MSEQASWAHRGRPGGSSTAATEDRRQPARGARPRQPKHLKLDTPPYFVIGSETLPHGALAAHSLEHVSAAGLGLLAGLALPHAHHLALHGELRGQGGAGRARAGERRRVHQWAMCSGAHQPHSAGSWVPVDAGLAACWPPTARRLGAELLLLACRAAGCQAAAVRVSACRFPTNGPGCHAVSLASSENFAVNARPAAKLPSLCAPAAGAGRGCHLTEQSTCCWQPHAATHARECVPTAPQQLAHGMPVHRRS